VVIGDDFGLDRGESILRAEFNQNAIVFFEFLDQRVIEVGGDKKIFTITEQFLADRSRNILWGGALSLVLVAAIAFGRYRYPETYNDVLLWSVVAFVIGANLINYLRHRRYLRLIRDHVVEVRPGKLRFLTGAEESELDLNDVALVNLFRRMGVLRHIQIRLENNRGIRLEGYGDLERLAGLLAEQVPKAHVVERQI